MGMGNGEKVWMRICGNKQQWKMRLTIRLRLFWDR